MELLLKRSYKKENYTIGNLYIDGKWFCNTIEDKDRGLDDSMSADEIRKIKIYAKTAIPTGRYRVALNIVSPSFSKKKAYKKYSGKVPRLIDVKGYEGILIHIGNTERDSAGCILVGLNLKKGMILKSTETFYKLMDEYLLKAKERDEAVFITIK